MSNQNLNSTLYYRNKNVFGKTKQKQKFKKKIDNPNLDTYEIERTLAYLNLVQSRP